MVCMAAPPAGEHIDPDDLVKSSQAQPQAPQSQLVPPQARPLSSLSDNHHDHDHLSATDPFTSLSDNHHDHDHLSDASVPWSLPVLQSDCLDAQMLGDPPISTSPTEATITQPYRSRTPTGVLHNPQPTAVYFLNKIALQVRC